MIVGYDVFGYNDGGFFLTLCGVGKIYQVKLMNSIVDELYINTDINRILTNIKEGWDAYTVLKAEFKNNLEAGNVTNSNVPIEKLRFKKRLITEFEWQTVGETKFDINKKIYYIVDPYVSNIETYEYAVVPVTGNVEGQIYSITVSPKYSGAWLVDDTFTLYLGYGLDYNIEYEDASNVYETVGRKYPFVFYNPVLNYRRGNVSCILVSTDYADTLQYNTNIEYQFKRNVMNFLLNHKTKVLKLDTGEYMCVNVIGKPQLKPVNNMFYQLNFEFVEVMDANEYNKNTVLSVY